MKAKMLGLLALGLLVASAADATTSYVGFDLAPNEAVDPAKAPSTTRATFEATLDPNGIKREDFESTEPGGTPNPLLGQASMTGDGRVSDSADNNRFNTTATGRRWWDSAEGFDLVLDGGYNGFGFYATDVGDFGGTLTVSLFAGGSADPFFTSEAFSCSAMNSLDCGGSLFFLGFTSATLFNRILVTINQPQGMDVGSEDFIGFDDLVLGRFADGGPSPVPEPSTLALLGLGLAGLGLSRRRKAA